MIFITNGFEIPIGRQRMNAYEYIKGCDIGQKRKFVIVKVIRNVYERVTVFYDMNA